MSAGVVEDMIATGRNPDTAGQRTWPNWKVADALETAQARIAELEAQIKGVVDHTAKSVAEMLRLHAHDDCGEKYLDTHSCNIAAVFVEAQAARIAELEGTVSEMEYRAEGNAEAAQFQVGLLAEVTEQRNGAQAEIASLRAQLAEARAQIEADRDTFRDADIINDPIGAAAQMEAAFRNCQRALATPQEGESVIRKPTELLTDNNRISGESDA